MVSGKLTAARRSVCIQALAKILPRTPGRGLKNLQKYRAAGWWWQRILKRYLFLVREANCRAELATNAKRRVATRRSQVERGESRTYQNEQRCSVAKRRTEGMDRVICALDKFATGLTQQQGNADEGGMHMQCREQI
jgi:hypothetical protein